MKYAIRTNLPGRAPLVSVVIMAVSICAALGASDQSARETVTKIISQLQQADYAGDQAAMQKSYDELTPFLENKELASRVRYWHGFAMWRRAINGFNDAVDPEELKQDLKLGIDEFKEALALDPKFVDAKIALISCFGYFGFANMKDPEKAREFFAQAVPLAKEAKEAAQDNPRLLWVLGPVLWNTPPERGGGQDAAIANYEKALEFARKSKTTDALEPSWGEPELMMNLAWSHLNKTKPDVPAAERFARATLALVPHWHYVRDILLPQILAAKTK